MSALDELRESVERVWKQRPQEYTLCLRLISYLSTPPTKHNLTLGMLKDGAGIKSAQSGSEGEAQFASVLQYFLLSTFAPLEMRFEIVGEDGFPVDVSADQMAEARSDLTHPLTGLRDEAVLSQITVLFRPADWIQPVDSGREGS
ncbi:hypothetical protein ACS5PN_16430 [Roseateles sp. NT4]|uniref:hypothetical protein n=1 Tax=Roseateles sp. NT4 TaxID=3453715 RepID=UPI003EECBA04